MLGQFYRLVINFCWISPARLDIAPASLAADAADLNRGSAVGAILKFHRSLYLHRTRRILAEKNPGSSWLEDPRARRALPQISSSISVDDIFLFDQNDDLALFVEGNLDEAATIELSVKDQIGDSILEMIFEHST